MTDKAHDTPCGGSHDGCCGHGTSHDAAHAAHADAGKMHGYMDTCLLVLLRGGADHGYSLLERLGDFGLCDINASTLYRVMRRMEGMGWVSSKWAEGENGPQRRMYAITAQGEQALDAQIGIFEKRRTRIDTLLAAYEKRGAKR